MRYPTFPKGLKRSDISEKHATIFWKKVDVTDADSCWIWRGYVADNGYGSFTIAGKPPRGAHRYAYVLTKGDLKLGEMVCHKCDNPLCVNPCHLFAGTQKENLHDMMAKLRHPFGQKNGNSKLTEADVISIRREYDAGGTSHQKLADKWGLSRVWVQKILYKIAWSRTVDLSSNSTKNTNNHPAPSGEKLECHGISGVGEGYGSEAGFCGRGEHAGASIDTVNDDLDLTRKAVG
jgi:hypothetical protein